jgi:predicted O-methyltransferase YrrM
MDPATTPRIAPLPAVQYQAETEPELVRRARGLALREFGSWRAAAPDLWPPPDSCSTEVGRLLRVLAASVREGIAGEIGTGLGVAAAWITSGLSPTVPFVTVELDQRKARFAGRVFEGHDNVKLITGDWHDLLPFGPFSFLFVDVPSASREPPQRIVDAMATGGIMVLDGLTPRHLWTPEERERWAVDPVRALWLEHPSLMATELAVRPDRAVIVATPVGRRPA